MEKISGMTVEGFAQALAAKTPVPGGGGASAAAAAFAASLCAMVGNYTVGKKKYAEVEEDVKRISARAEELSARLVMLIDEDAENFGPLSAAYGIPKDAPGRDEELEKCLRSAASAPLRIAQLCAETAQLLCEMHKKGSSIMLSDVYTGAALLRGAAEGAAVNVRVNTELMKDREYARSVEEELEEALSRVKEGLSGI